ncbi:MAG: transposase [Patescibacteria group bacterium]|nr:transposase [Patescibacteria group bacterium]
MRKYENLNIKYSMHHLERKRNRLPNYDYTRDGWYFVTICIKDRIEFFGDVSKNQMILNEIGMIAKNCWLEIPKHFPDVGLDEFIIMPNHIHGIIIIDHSKINDMDVNIIVGNKNFCSLQYCSLQYLSQNQTQNIHMTWQTKLSRSLSSIIRGFKIGVTKQCRQNNQNDFQWQKSFYDHIIRDEKSLQKIREYIRNNPSKYNHDKNHFQIIP